MDMGLSIIGASLSEPHTSRKSVQSRYLVYYVACDLMYTIVDKKNVFRILNLTYVTVILQRHGHFPHIRHYSAGTVTCTYHVPRYVVTTYSHSHVYSLQLYSYCYNAVWLLKIKCFIHMNPRNSNPRNSE